MIRVTIWNEYLHEVNQPEVAAIYPDGIHGCIKASLEANPEITVKTATLAMDNHGLTDEILNETDVLIWWGHMAHDKVSDETAQLVQKHVLAGMGLIALHSAHHSKPMKLLMGTTLNLKWRHGDRERVWCINPSHPIAKGVPEQFVLEKEEMYGEPFDIPEPDETVFMGWFAGGEVFRSGVTFRRGKGKIFYFQPGHEEYPVYHDKNVKRVIENAVFWACGNGERKEFICENPEPLEQS
ncbi:MAG: ThuA domain-containing protein [Oscillospiraceae bacterium]|nr:ThuA domain-containing protein [Oscillospiraceae bacterium]